MEHPTYEQIEQWRKRWKKYPTLPNIIRAILLEDGHPPKDAEEATSRMWRVNDALRGKEEFRVHQVVTMREMRTREDFYTVFIGPILDLRGISWEDENLQGISINRADLQGANLNDVNLQGALLYEANLQGAVLFEANLQGADLSIANLQGANLSFANLQGADLWRANLQGANLSWSDMGVVEDDETTRKKTTFSYTDFLPRWSDFFTERFYWRNVIGFLKGIRWKDAWKFTTQRWFYTEFIGVRIDDADTVLAADLKRYVNDQQYLLRFRTRHPKGYFLWKWLAGCGENVLLIFFWSFIVIWIFSLLIWSVPWQTPEWIHWLPQFLIMHEKPIDPSAYVANYPNLADSWKWFFVSFDIFTNLGIRNTHPQNPIGVILVFLETVAGFLALGTLIAVATNKWVRKA